MGLSTQSIKGWDWDRQSICAIDKSVRVTHVRTYITYIRVRTSNPAWLDSGPQLRRWILCFFSGNFHPFYFFFPSWNSGKSKRENIGYILNQIQNAICRTQPAGAWRYLQLQERTGKLRMRWWCLLNVNTIKRLDLWKYGGTFYRSILIWALQNDSLQKLKCKTLSPIQIRSFVDCKFRFFEKKYLPVSPKCCSKMSFLKNDVLELLLHVLSVSIRRMHERWAVLACPGQANLRLRPTLSESLNSYRRRRWRCRWSTV